jgi:hypothetical protein
MMDIVAPFVYQYLSFRWLLHHFYVISPHSKDRGVVLSIGSSGVDKDKKRDMVVRQFQGENVMKVDWSPLSPNGHFDASMHMGDLRMGEPAPAPEWPMYSYSRPSYMVWDAIGQVMIDNGMSVDQVKDWLQSKNPRYALDGTLGDVLVKAATEWAQAQAFE